MNLKGYQWLDNNGKVIMWYSSKYNQIRVLEDITSKQHLDFYNFLKKQGIKCSSTDFNNHTMIDLVKE